MVATTVSVSVVLFAYWPLRRWAFSRAAEQADVVVDAIKRFEQAERRLPTSLNELVPAYLKYVPPTGLLEHPSFEYEARSFHHGSLVWWDLGSRGGASTSGPWVYPDGNPDHAILAVEFDDQGRVQRTHVDRMPESTTTRPFNSGLWRTGPEQRQHMIWDLATQLELRQMDLAAFEVLLGAPSGTRAFSSAPWELRIPCSRGMGNWDVFFYWPTENYPTRKYGGGIERIGRWAYVHE